MELKTRSIISCVGIFLALLLPLRLPDYFWLLMIGIILGAGLLTFWIFDEKPNLKRLKEDWFTITFLAVYVVSGATFAYLVQHPLVQALLLALVALGTYYIYIVANRLKRGYKPALFFRNVTFVATLLVIFFSVTDILRYILILDSAYAGAIMLILVFASVFVACEFLFETQSFERSIIYSLTLAFAITQIVWISSYWSVSYPYSSKMALIGVPLPAVLSAIFFYLFWGLSHHRLEGTLTRKVIIEYLLISLVFTGVLFITTKWIP